MGAATDIVNAIADSIVAEVEGADEWDVLRCEPIWKNPKKGKQLAIYVLTEANAALSNTAGTGGFRTTGYHEDAYTVGVEYIEPAASSQARQLRRDEEAELGLYDIADSFRAWADGHQALPEASVHRFDWLQTSHAPAQRQELLVRFFQVQFQARMVHQYA